MRVFQSTSSLYEGNLALAIAPALTPSGVIENPLFFSGEMKHPLVISGGILVLADIVGTRYFQYTPAAFRDPVLSAQGDRLRAECFSACNGVYARLDIFQNALDGDILYGTTNVDIGINLQKSLMQMKRGNRLKLQIGNDGLQAFHYGKGSAEASVTKISVQRPVKMPERWIRAMGNCAMLHQNMKYKFHVEGMAAKMFIAALPPVTGKEQSGWLTPTKSGVILKSVKERNSVYISGLHRLCAIKRLMSEVNSVYFYAREDEEKGQMMVEVCMTGANLILGLTTKSYQGYSGEGSLLESLSDLEVVENAEQIASVLNFESRLNLENIAKSFYFNKEDVHAAMGLLAVSGKLGFDVREHAFFHRELPDDPDRVLKDNPRLLSARKLVEDTVQMEEDIWQVKSKDVTYRIIYDPQKKIQEGKCTCTWYLNHQNSRGPCKHILAVKLKVDKNSDD